LAFVEGAIDEHVQNFSILKLVNFFFDPSSVFNDSQGVVRLVYKYAAINSKAKLMQRSILNLLTGTLCFITISFCF